MTTTEQLLREALEVESKRNKMCEKRLRQESDLYSRRLDVAIARLLAESAKNQGWDDLIALAWDARKICELLPEASRDVDTLLEQRRDCVG